MLTPEEQKRFETFVMEEFSKKESERIAGQPDPEAEQVRKLNESTPADEVFMTDLDFGKEFTNSTIQTEEVKVLERARIMEAALDTIDYLGWLRGKKIEAKLDADNYLSGFYQARHDRFVKENTP